jgi:hypothetical protein
MDAIRKAWLTFVLAHSAANSGKTRAIELEWGFDTPPMEPQRMSDQHPSPALFTQVDITAGASVGRRRSR